MKLETIKIGRIVNAHGIRGEVRVQPRDLDPHLYIRRADAHLPEGTYFDDELLGLQVYDADSSECLGELVRVEQYPAHRVYTVRGTHEYLIPAVPDVFIKSVDLDANRMEVHTLEGMATDAD